MLQGQEIGEPDSEKEVMDKGSDEDNGRNEGSVECASSSGDIAEIEILDKIIDGACDDLDLMTTGKTFKKLDIFLPFEVPLCHTIENKITHGISDKEYERLNELKIKFRNGRFNPEEDALLKANWETFSKQYGFSDPEPFLPGVKNCFKPIQRKKFVQWLGHGLENRSLNSIFSRFRLLYSNTSKTKSFTEFEDKLIKRCLERNMKMPFVVLSTILKRERMYISKHYRLTQKSPYSSKGKVHWNLTLIKLFIETLMSSLSCCDMEELRDLSLPPHVWNSISEVLQVPASRCRSFWNRKLSTQLFAEQPVYKHHLCTTLLLRFWKKSAQHIYWQDISWSRVAKHYKGIGPIFLARTFKSFVRENVPQRKWNSLKACLKYLRKHWLLKLSGTKFTVSLTRLKYINGQLITLTDK